ncbi:MAG TPA: Mut7-C RNAse domain-containing protein [Bryobacteraceae bacterium]|nr:Mut7-C RNAse domain-containing protein [Bryobacteraceae bacterium]
MKRAVVRFYAELNDFVPPAKRYRDIEVLFHVGPAVRDLIESEGIPHTEVDLVLVNGESAPFTRVVEDRDRISVYPVFESFDIAPLSLVRPEPLRHPRFLLDVHLGRLAAYLRMAGFDAAYADDAGDAALARTSAAEERILLTRDRGLLKRAAVTRGYYVRETAPFAQLREVVARFDLRRLLAPFTRCLACNGELRDVTAVGVAERVPAEVLARHTEFRECPACARVYWKGSHYERMQALLAQL